MWSLRCFQQGLQWGSVRIVSMVKQAGAVPVLPAGHWECASGPFASMAQSQVCQIALMLERFRAVFR